MLGEARVEYFLTDLARRQYIDPLLSFASWFAPISLIEDLVCADPCFFFRSHLGFADPRFAFDLRLMLRIAFLFLVSSFTNRLCRVWFVCSFVLGVVFFSE